MRRQGKLLAALAVVLLQAGCFVVRDAVVDTAKTGVYVAKKGAHVAVKSTEVVAKETERTGVSAAHAVSRAGEAGAAAPAPTP